MGREHSDQGAPGGAVRVTLDIGEIVDGQPKSRNVFAGIKSAYELLEMRFSRPVRVMAASLYSFHLLLRMGMLIYGPSLVLMKITGAPYWGCATDRICHSARKLPKGGVPPTAMAARPRIKRMVPYP